MRARWAANKVRAGDGSDSPAAASASDMHQQPEAVTAMQLFAAGVIQGQTAILPEEEFGSELIGSVEFSLAPAILEATPRFKEAKPVVLVRDEGDTGAASSIGFGSEVYFDRVTLEEDRMRVTDKRQFLLPWERGPLRRIFGDTPLIKKPKLSVQPSALNSVRVAVGFDASTKATAYIDKVVEPRSTAIFVSVVHSTVDIDHKAEKAKKRVEAVANWWSIISRDLAVSTIGRKVLTSHALRTTRTMVASCWMLALA